MKNIQVTEKTKFILPILANSRAITPKVLHGIWLVIELGGDILPTNIFTKFAEYTMKTNKVIERTNTLDAAPASRVPIICPVFSNGHIKMAKTRHIEGLPNVVNL